MNILYITPYYTPAFSYGGIPRTTSDLAEGIAKNAHKVTVITTDVFDNKRRNPIKTETINGVEVVRFRNYSNLLAKHLNFYNGSKVSKWAKENISKFDIVHFADVYSFLFLKPIYKYIKKHKIPYIIKPHGTLIFKYLNIFHTLYFLRNLALYINKPILENTELFISTSYNETMEIQEKYPTKIIIEIPNGIRPLFYDENSKAKYKNKYFPNENRKIFISVERLSHIKGFDRAINVMTELYKINKNFIYLIYGPSEKGYLDKLNNMIINNNAGDYIKLKNGIFGDEKNEILLSSDLFILSSYSESHGMAALDAINLGVPALISEESYHQNYYNGYKCCKKSNFNNPKELAQEINYLISNDNILFDLKSDTKDLIDKHFNFEKYISKTEQVYNDVINKNK